MASYAPALLDTGAADYLVDHFAAAVSNGLFGIG